MEWTPRMSAALLFVGARRARRERLLTAMAQRTSVEALQRELKKLED
jgi:hypothetical protein